MSFLDHRYSKKIIVRNSILFISISFFVIGLLFSSTNVLVWSLCFMLAHNLWYACEKFSERIIFFAFNCTFFTFLVGRLVIKTFTGYVDPWSKSPYGLDFQDDNIILSIFIILYLGLLFLYFGYRVVKNKNLNFKKSKLYSFRRVESIAFVSKYLFYFTYIFNVLILRDKANFTDNNGYAELYASYSSSYPGWVEKLSQMCPTALFIYLGTLPSKRKSFFPLVLYVISGVLSLIVGQRNNFVLNLLIVLVYLCLRNITDKKQRWFGKKEIISCIVSFPVIVVILNAVSHIRFESSSAPKSFLDGISEFFYNQGVSVNLIGYAQTLDQQFLVGKNYTFGRIIDFLNNNSITQSIFHVPKYNSQTLESALYGNSFADSVSYILSPSRYLKGWGYGSSYLAELFHDGGYAGVIIGSFILGIILALMIRAFKHSILGIWMCLSMTRLLLYVPRDTSTSFFVSTFTLINILTLFIIFLIASLLCKNKSERSPLYTLDEIRQ